VLPLPFYLAKVLDSTTSAAGAYAARVLADLGAEVLLIERTGAARPASGPEFEALQRNKFSCAIALDLPEGKDLWLKLARRCDFAFVDAGDERLASAGLTYAALAAENQGLICVEVELSESRAIGLAAASAALTALFYRRGSGLGQRIAVHEQAVLASLLAISDGDTASGVGEKAAGPKAAPNVLEEIGTAEGDIVPVEGVPYRFSSTPAHVRLPAPRYGQHTMALLRELAGLDEAELRRLREAGVIDG
jgi:crotonobetainyl-CoA:carnitine CoA-transferase CaiB-like acyl-CoA transferase